MKKNLVTKIAAIALTLVMVMGLAACGASGSSTTELKTLTIYSDGAPGSSADNIMRTLGGIIQEQTGITVEFENVTGGGGSNAKTAMMTNKKTTGIVMDTCSLTLEIADGTAPYDLTKLTPVTTIAQEYVSIAVAPDSPFNDLNDLVEYAKANPGTINWGASSARGSQQLFEQYVVDETGIDISYVPYDSAQNAKVAVLAGDLDVGTATTGNYVSDFIEGVYKCLAVSSPERMSEIPDVPTLAELGFTGPANGNSVWRGFFCSAGLDDELVTYLAEIIDNARNTDEWRTFMVSNHISAWDLDHDSFVTFVNEYLATCGDALARMD